MKGETIEFNFEDVQNDEMCNTPREEDLIDITNLNLDLFSDDEDNDISSVSFAKLAESFTDLTKDGHIKKRIKRQGKGNIPPDHALVRILYCSYLEYYDEPTDYAYIKKPLQFRLGSAGILGLNIAVASMKVTEKAHFLIGPDYAFGKMGHPPRIPPNSTFFFQIELLKYSDSGPALQFENLTRDDRKSFACAFKTASGLMESAKENVKCNTKLSIREYNRALSLLDDCHLADITEQEEQQKMRLHILTNLAICYNKENLPKKCCMMCNDIFNMIKNTSLPVPAKVYFHNGRALMMIGEYQQAKKKLLQAQRLEPKNDEISKELIKINEKIESDKLKEKKLAKIYLQSSDKPSTSKQEKQTSEEIEVEESGSYSKLIVSLCDDLLNSRELQYALPSGLSDIEYETAKKIAQKKGLKFRESMYNENNGQLTFYITKM